MFSVALVEELLWCCVSLPSRGLAGCRAWCSRWGCSRCKDLMYLFHLGVSSSRKSPQIIKIIKAKIILMVI